MNRFTQKGPVHFFFLFLTAGSKRLQKIFIIVFEALELPVIGFSHHACFPFFMAAILDSVRALSRIGIRAMDSFKKTRSRFNFSLERKTRYGYYA